MKPAIFVILCLCLVGCGDNKTHLEREASAVKACRDAGGEIETVNKGTWYERKKCNYKEATK